MWGNCRVLSAIFTALFEACEGHSECPVYPDLRVLSRFGCRCVLPLARTLCREDPTCLYTSQLLRLVCSKSVSAGSGRTVSLRVGPTSSELRAFRLIRVIGALFPKRFPRSVLASVVVRRCFVLSGWSRRFPCLPGVVCAALPVLLFPV